VDPTPHAALADAARAYLLALTDGRWPLTYRAVADALRIPSPHTIHKLVGALEQTMREDAAAGRPFIAARVVSRSRGGLPAPGFFALAAQLGRHDGSETGPQARAFHAGQLQALAQGCADSGEATSGGMPTPT